LDVQRIKKEIGRKLKLAREEKGYSQQEMGDMLGLTRVGYGAFERGDNLISLEYLLQLPQILDKPISYFLPDSAMSEAEKRELALDPGFREVMEAWPELDKEGRELVYKAARVAMKGSRPRLRLVAEKEAGYKAGDLEGEIADLVRQYPDLGPIFEEARETLPEHAVKALMYNVQIWIRQGAERDSFAEVHRKLGDLMI
jgi:transcriptional regulator with XRE-family HTH domain